MKTVVQLRREKEFEDFVKANVGSFVIAHIVFTRQNEINVQIIRKGKGKLYTKNLINAKIWKTYKAAYKNACKEDFVFEIGTNGKLKKHFG